MTELWRMGVVALAEAIAARRVSPVEVMRATLARIDAVNGAVNAIVSLGDREALMGAARVAEAMPPTGPLHGVPVAIKDLVSVKGVRSTSGAPFLADHVPTVDDGLARRMKAAGAIIIGKTNVPMFGLGSHSTNPVFGVTRNPHDLSRTAGGSSGGAGAALATGMLSVADGSDMMGSLRNPAAWNDVYGVRPTVGLVAGEPRAAWMQGRLSTNGPMGRSVADMERLLSVLSDGAYSAVPGAGRPPRVGWLGDWGGAYAMAPGLLDLAETAARRMADLGWHVAPLTPPMAADALWDSWTDLRSFVVAQERAEDWADPTRRVQLNPQAVYEVTRGRAMDGARVARAAALRRDWLAVLEDVFTRVDLLVLPATQTWPFPAEWDWPREIAGRAMDTYHRWMEIVVPASLAGLPAVGLPAGFGPDGLPGGVQMIGAPGSDAQLLAWARDYEAAIGPRSITDPARQTSV
jgi:amidase